MFCDMNLRTRKVFLLTLFFIFDRSSGTAFGATFRRIPGRLSQFPSLLLLLPPPPRLHTRNTPVKFCSKTMTKTKLNWGNRATSSSSSSFIFPNIHSRCHEARAKPPKQKKTFITGQLNSAENNVKIHAEVYSSSVDKTISRKVHPKIILNSFPLLQSRGKRPKVIVPVVICLTK